MDTAPPTQPVQRADYDSPWKEILERYFPEFLEFFFPVAYEGIDWSQGHEFLDKELQKVTRKAEVGRKVVDKLVKVYTTDGTETWVVVHVEVQGQYEADFAKRMYVYNYRLFDRYNRDIVSLAILSDDRKRWKPKRFQQVRWGCETRFTFPRVKLLDYADREDEFATSRNPFAVMVLAYLKTRATRTHPEDRLQWKLRLFKLLYERGYRKEDVVELMRFIDWVMELPEAFENQFDEAVFQYEEEHRMHYVTSFERYGMKKGLQQGSLNTAREAVIDTLQVRFDLVPEPIIEAIDGIDELPLLKRLRREAVTVSSVEEFLAILDRQAVAA
ncbi:MAG: hypothetical protein JW902_07315 [Syntrophaceae bacterium]|nr:hypothetical protein [Syntrophaceae bacterium]